MAVLLQRVDRDRNMHRYYEVDVQPDLFGRWLLRMRWGRIGCGGRTRLVSFATEQEAMMARDQKLAAKEKRGYLVDS